MNDEELSQLSAYTTQTLRDRILTGYGSEVVEVLGEEFFTGFGEALADVVRAVASRVRSEALEEAKRAVCICYAGTVSRAHIVECPAAAIGALEEK